MVCPHRQPAHGFLWRRSIKETVQRPQPKAGISEKMRGREGDWEPAHPIVPHGAIFKAVCGTDTGEVSSSSPGTQTQPSYGVK